MANLAKARRRRNIKILNQILNFIYPPSCGICGRLNKEFLCSKCKKTLENQSEFKIEKKSNNYFQEHLYLFKYQGIIRKILINYKFNDKPYIHKTIVNFLSKNEKFFENLKSYDTIIPVPISKKRYKERGYNQSSLIAKEIVKQVNDKQKLSYNDKCLLKTKNIIEQSKLSKEERQKNIKGVYELYNAKILENKKILLIDDIYTTGSTVTECSKTLTEAKPKKIGVLTIAKD